MGRGAVLALTGAAGICLGGVTVFADWFLIGFVISLGGVLALSVGVALMAEPWFDESIDAQIDAWERDWEAQWSPECPVHHSQMCYARTRKCPMTRVRENA